MAYPLLLQSISRIDQKYNTSVLTQRFKKEKTYHVFQWVLGISLVYALIHFSVSEHIVWIFNWDTLLDEFMNASSSLFFILCTITLVVVLMLLIKRIMVYYDHSELLKSIFKEFKDFDDIKDEDLNTLLALSKYNLKRNDDDEDVVYELYNKLYDYAFAKYLDNDK